MITFPRFLHRSCRYIDTCRDIICNLSSHNQYYSLQRRISPTNFTFVRSCSGAVEPIDAVKTAATKYRKKTPEVPKITLLNTNNSIHSVTTVSEAERIAAGCNLKLVRIVDPEMRTTRPVFRLMTDAQFLEEEIRERGKLTDRKKQSQGSASKTTKLMMLTCLISENDFQTKINKSRKWLEKGYEVRFAISGSTENVDPQEEMYKRIIKELQGMGKIVQKIIKNGTIKFQIVPPTATPSKEKEQRKKTAKDELTPESILREFDQ